MPRVKLTQRFIDKIHSAVGNKKEEWFDIEIKGFYLEVRQSGGKTYRLRVRDQGGKVSVLNLGDAYCVTFASAREKARDLRAQAQLGVMPSTGPAPAETVAPSFDQFVEDRYLPYATERKRSIATDISVLNNHLLPAFGGYAIDKMTRASIVEFHTQKHREGYAAGTVDRMVILLRFILNLAVKWNLISADQHPARNFDFFNLPNGRERFLTPHELERLASALRQSENPDLLLIVQGLLLTGCRRGELLNSRWCDVDFERGLWTIPITKQGRPHRLPLSEDLSKYFSQLPSRGKSEFVFPSPRTGRPYKSIFCSWDRARRLAEMPDLRIHDLRHSFASFLVNSGRSLYEVQRLLGHTTPKTTQRYAHLSLDALTEAVSVAGNTVGITMGEVCP